MKDIGSVFASRKAAGVAFQAAPHVVNRAPDPGLWLAEFSAPDGNLLALMREVAVAGA